MASNPYINLLSTAWVYAKGERKKYLRTYSFFAFSNLTDSVLPLLYGWMINGIQQHGFNVINYAWKYAAAYMGLKIFEWVFHGPARVWERSLAFNLSRNFKMELYHQALHLPIKWHQDHHSGAIISRISKAYEALKNFFQDGFMFFHALAKFIISFSAMLYFSPLFGSIGLLMGIVTVWCIFMFDKPLIKYLHETNEKEHLVSSNLFDSLSNIHTVITLRLQSQMMKGLYKQIQQVWPPFLKNITLNEWKWFIADTLVALIYAIIVFGYIYQEYKPGTVFYIGGLVALISYVHQFTSVFHDIAWQYNQIVRYNTDVLSVRSIQEDYKNLHPSVTDFQRLNEWNTLNIYDLNYSHQIVVDDKIKDHNLHGIHMQLTKGKRIAIIGESGSGKSTLLAVLRGLYTPLSGTKLMKDQHTQMPFESIHDHVTLFPQDPEIFENTIRYNITLGLDYTEDEIKKACETVAFQEVIDLLPHKLESSIKEKGVNLSGGQKQRLALARGILAAENSDIILMDEPTSSVDPKTELMIYNRLFNMFESKVLVSALHRLHLLEYFDYIYVMHDGKIIEEGTCKDLKANGIVFNELWRHLEIENE